MKAGSDQAELAADQTTKKQTMNNNKNVTLKIFGEYDRVLKALDILEGVFPLSVRSKIIPSSDGVNFHTWLTVALDDNSGLVPREDQARISTATPANFNYAEVMSK